MPIICGMGAFLKLYGIQKYVIYFKHMVNLVFMIIDLTVAHFKTYKIS